MDYMIFSSKMLKNRSGARTGQTSHMDRNGEEVETFHQLRRPHTGHSCQRDGHKCRNNRR